MKNCRNFLFFNLFFYFQISLADVIDPSVCESSFPPVDPSTSGTCSTREVQGWSASVQEIRNITCKPQMPSKEEMIAFIENNISGPKSRETKTINGVHFIEENPILLQHFDDLTTKRDFILSDISEVQDNVQAKYHINPKCQKVMCAVEKMFGNQAIKTLYLKTKYELNVSNHAWGLSSRPTESELNDLLMAAETTPPHFLPLEKNKRYSRFTRGVSFGGPTTLANASISFFDFWSTFPSEHRQYAAFHELSHNVGGELGLDDSEEWLKISGWVQFGDEWEPQFPTTFTSRYAATNPHEDFAESMAAYRYNPDLLIDISPEKYEFLRKNVFFGIEYFTEEKCKRPAPIISSIIKEDIKFTPDKNDYLEILDICHKTTANYLTGINPNFEIYQNCIQKASKKYEVIKKAKILYPGDNDLISAISSLSLNNFEEDIDQITPTISARDVMQFAKNDIINKVIEELESHQSFEHIKTDEEKKKSCENMINSARIEILDSDKPGVSSVNHSLYKLKENESNQLMNFKNKCNEIGILNVTKSDVIEYFQYIDSLTPQEKSKITFEISLLKEQIREKNLSFESKSKTQQLLGLYEHRQDIRVIENRITTLKNQLTAYDITF